MQATTHRDPVGTGQGTKSLLCSWVFALGAMLVGATAAAAGGDPTHAQERYQQERAICISGQSHQDRDTCLREADAARQEAKPEKPTEGTSSHEDNQLARCERLAASDREDCVRRLREGTASGSVEGGGIYRELRTTVPAK
jgi:hypothetical protein